MDQQEIRALKARMTRLERLITEMRIGRLDVDDTTATPSTPTPSGAEQVEVPRGADGR